MKNKKIKVIKRNIDPQTFRNMTMQYDKNDNFKSLNLFFKFTKNLQQLKIVKIHKKYFPAIFFHNTKIYVLDLL